MNTSKVYVNSLMELSDDYTVINLSDMKDFISYAKDIQVFEEMANEVDIFDSSNLVIGVLKLLKNDRFLNIFNVYDNILKGYSENSKMVFVVNKSEHEKYRVIVNPAIYFKDIFETIGNAIIKYLV